MNTIDRLIEELRPIAEKLGEGAEELFRLAVRQAYIDGITNLAIGIALMVLCVVAYKVVRWCHNQYPEARKARSFGGGDGYLFGGVVTVFVGLIAFGLSIGCLVTAINALANPQFYAAQRLLESVTGG